MSEDFDRRWIVLAVFGLVAVGVVAAILISRSGGSSSSGSTGTTASASGCKQVPKPKPEHVSFKAPPQKVKTGEPLSAEVKTNCGTFTIALDTKQAPKIVNSFVFLTEQGFYNGLLFHRIIPGFVVQGGDPLGNGSGGPGYSVVEKPPKNLSYTKGVVAMAKTGSDPSGSAGSQFFVVVAPNAGLPPEYALLGDVSKGYDIVARIAKLGSQSGTPKQTVVMEHISIVKS